MQRPVLARWILTIALAVVFGFFGIDKFWHPLSWIGWIPAWMDGFLTLDAGLWLQIIGAFEILCAVLIILPVRAFRQTGCILMALQILAMLPIVGFNDVSVRDFGLMLAAISLWAMH